MSQPLTAEQRFKRRFADAVEALCVLEHRLELSEAANVELRAELELATGRLAELELEQPASTGGAGG